MIDHQSRDLSRRQRIVTRPRLRVHQRHSGGRRKLERLDTLEEERQSSKEIDSTYNFNLDDEL